MGNVQMEAGQVRYKGSTYKNMQTAMDAALGGGGGSSTLAELTDTDISTPTNGQVLTYDSTAEKWENANIPTPSTPALSDLTDTAISTPTNGQVLTYDSTAEKWVNASAGGGGGSGYTDTAIEEHTFEANNTYETIATISVPAGVYHVIAGIYTDNATYPANYLKFMDNSLTCIEVGGSGWQNPCLQSVFNGGTAGKTITLQAKGNTVGKCSGFIMMRKLADAPSNNESR